MIVQHFALNTTGTDYVVGDIHGEFPRIKRLLDEIGFNYLHDRLFSVGDMVDRGAHSAEVLDWLDKPWFHAIRGNHEQMVIDVQADPTTAAIGMHLMNGGAWFQECTPEQQERIATEFGRLPLVIEIEIDRGVTAGLVHAEIPFGWTWEQYIEMLDDEDSYTTYTTLWGRDRIYRHVDNDEGVPGIGMVYHGHTPVKRTARRGNIFYLDTGGWFGEHFTIIDITTGKFFTDEDRFE
jgi:serine/threonine protein phosphatase 1